MSAIEDNAFAHATTSRKRKARIAELEAALAWYGEQARLCRLVHSGGDEGRRALAADGGKRARDLLPKSEAV